jgi:hypothetical protein
MAKHLMAYQMTVWVAGVQVATKTASVQMPSRQLLQTA